MAYLACIGSHKVNGVAELHSDLIKTTIFKDFVKIYGPDKFTNVTNGITPRRWLHQANPQLSKLIASKIGSFDFLKDLNLLSKLEGCIDDKAFRKQWADIKTFNKARLAKLIFETTGIKVTSHALYDIQVKRIHEYKRQQLNVFGCIHRYLQIKAMTPEQKKECVPRVSIFGGKAAPGYWMAKTVIHLVNKVGDVINNDPDVGDLLKVVFIPDYNVSKAEIIVPASDISEHISTAGTEASGTSNMKFVLNGGLIIGTCDGANVSLSLLLQTLLTVFRSKSLVRLVKAIYSFSVTCPKTLKSSATLMSMATINLTNHLPKSLMRLRKVLSVMPTNSQLSFMPLLITEITTLSRMISPVTSKPKISSMKASRTKKNGLQSVSPVLLVWDSSVLIVAWMNMLRVSGILNLCHRKTTVLLSKRITFNLSLV